MHVVELAEGATFESAVELGNSTARPQSKSVGHKSSGNGVRAKTNKINLPGRMADELKKLDQSVTEENKRVLMIIGGRKHWVLLSEYRLTHPA